MRRLLTGALLLLLLMAALPALVPAHAQGAPKITVSSVYALDRYGFAIINESVTFENNESSAVQAPPLTFGFGDLASHISAYNLTGGGFTLQSPPSTGGPFTVSGGQSIPAGGSSSYLFTALVGNIVSVAANGSLSVMTLSSPSISAGLDKLTNEVIMPTSTSFKTNPTGLSANQGTTTTYTSSGPYVASQSAVTSVQGISPSSSQDFNPLHVYYAERTITLDAKGSPLVTDTLDFENMGTTPLATLYVTPLAPLGTTVTIETLTEPRLISPVTETLVSDSIDLTKLAVGYPNNGVPSGNEFKITYDYPLGTSHYSISGGEVSVTVPNSPPIRAFIDSYTIDLSLPPGATSKSAPAGLGSVNPWQTGETKFSYALSVGWTVDAGVPLATAVFALLLVGLYAVRTTPAEAEEEEEEESSSELAAAMIKAFDEKTNLINSLWPEITAKDPNEIDKEYFDELRGRLDSFRSRALQRLNEVRQKSTSQKFSEVVGQIHTTEREVDRAAKDKLNLYQQFYLRQMRREVYDRLLPQYTKRLEKALNQLSDELHTVQREAKLL